jgi:hypothetical protein
LKSRDAGCWTSNPDVRLESSNPDVRLESLTYLRNLRLFMTDRRQFSAHAQLLSFVEQMKD